MKINKEVKSMESKNIKRIVIGFLSVVLLGGLTWATDNTNSAMPLAQEGGTPRAMSLGSAVVGMPDLGVASLYWNPAGLASMSGFKELGLYHNSGLGDTQNERVAFGLPMCKLGGFAAGLNYVDNGTFEGRDSAGNPTSNYTAGDMGGSIGWGRQWFRNFSAGVALNYNQQTLANKAYEAYAATLGVLWNPLSRLNLGLTYTNLGTEVVGRRLDSGWRAGAAYDMSKNLLLALSGDLYPDGALNTLNVGIEDFLNDNLALRAGYVYATEEDKLDGITGVTVGVGVQVVKNIILDYAYIPYGDLGASQRASLTYKFGYKECPKTLTEVIQPEPVVEENVVILEKMIVLEDTHFEFDSAALTKKGEQILINNARIMRENPEIKIRVAGYASCSGTSEYNQALSERRAKSVMDVLVKEGGIAPERLTSIGYGSTKPAQFEQVCEMINTKAAHANMRVLFEIIVKQ